MKLIFKKEENNDISVKLQKGTIAIDFTYIEMIKQLLVNNKIDETEFGNLSQEEITSLEGMLKKISQIFEEDEEVPDESDIEEIL